MIEVKLRELFEETGLKQRFVAKKVGIDATTMGRLVSGKNMPSMERALRIAKFFGRHVDEIWVLREDDEE